MKKNTRDLSWVVSDGTKGMENQSVALAKLLNTDFIIIKYQPSFLTKNFPSIVKYIPQTLINFNFKQSSFPKYVITTGKRMAGISIAIKSYFKNKIKTIHIQNPKVLNTNFDLLLIPEHDKITGKNIIKTKGALSFFDSNTFQRDKRSLEEKTTIFLMIGGNNKRYALNNSDYYDLSMSVVNATKSLKAKLIISSSRRTAPKGIKIMQRVFKNNFKDFELYSSNDVNPYPDVLKYSDYVIVTSDSVNMISEVATLTTPLFIYYFPKETGKTLRFLDDLISLGIIKKFDGQLFEYNKIVLGTNRQTKLKINKFFTA
ncbi:mitochondrial fission ELM1 family protein [Alphaproteobacteria bacterium]|nr:mitochondrial fission ELM1 family protein [Alphaproteobacteria bacterium]